MVKDSDWTHLHSEGGLEEPGSGNNGWDITPLGFSVFRSLPTCCLRILKALSPSLNMGHLTWIGRAGVSVLERMDEEVKGQRESG